MLQKIRDYRTRNDIPTGIGLIITIPVLGILCCLGGLVWGIVETVS